MCECAETKAADQTPAGLNAEEMVDKLAQARALRERMTKGIDVIFETPPGTRRKQLKAFFMGLAKEYFTLMAQAAIHPLDIRRCPDCPHRGKDALYEIGNALVLCDTPCPPTGEPHADEPISG